MHRSCRARFGGLPVLEHAIVGDAEDLGDFVVGLVVGGADGEAQSEIAKAGSWRPINQGLAQAAGEEFNSLLLRFRQDEQKLVAAKTNNDVRVANLVLKEMSDLVEGDVAAGVAEAVVDAAEAGDVDHHQG